MSWLTDNITDPSAIIPPELYLALDALEILVASIQDAEGIHFDYDAFFSSTVTNVKEALRQIADYLSTTALNRQLLDDFVSSALSDATSYFNFLMTRDRVLGLIVLRVLTTPPAGADLEINILKNGLLIETLTIPDGSAGAVYKDLSHTSVVLGDIISVAVTKASGAVGLVCTLEV